MERDGVHVALHQDQIAQLAFLRQIQAEEVLALVEDQRLRRIEVFRRVGVIIVHDPAAEADDVAPDIDDGEHQPVPEPVVDIAVLLRFGHQARVDQLLLGVALGLHGLHQRIPGVGGVADAEGGQGRFGHPAASGILQRRSALRRIELAVEKPCGLLTERPQALLGAIAGLVLLVLRDLHPNPLGQSPDRVRVAQTLDLHLEIDDAAALVTAEAVVDALVRGHGEGGGLLPMEGAQPEQIAAGPLQGDIVPHHIFNWIPSHQLVNKGWWKCHITPPCLS